MILLTGGARSGKSLAAASLVLDHDRPVTYLATGIESDEEMRERIEAHREARPGTWSVVEEPVELTVAIEAVEEGDALVVDCLTLWVANLLEGLGDEEILERSSRSSRLAAEREGSTIVVTNEVGSGLVPMDHVGRRFRDLQGRVNQMWAARSDRAYLVVAGRLLELQAVDRPLV